MAPRCYGVRSKLCLPLCLRLLERQLAAAYRVLHIVETIAPCYKKDFALQQVLEPSLLNMEFNNEAYAFSVCLII